MFGEDWESSETTLIQPGAAAMPQCVDADAHYEMTIGTDRSLPCR